MPGGDKTGPMGTGPMSGRGIGFCAGYDVPGYANSGFGRGFGGGRGRGGGRGFGGRGFGGGGRGWRNRYWATGVPGWGWAGYDVPTAPPVANDRQMLKRQAAAMEEELEAIRRRLAELDQNSETSAD